MRISHLAYNFFSFIIAMISLLIMYPMGTGIFEKFSQYGVHYIFLLIMMGMMFLIVDLRRLMFTSLGCAALLCLFLKKHSNVNLILPEENQEVSLSIAHINLANAVQDIDQMAKKIAGLEADILSFQEFTPFWEDILDEYIAPQYLESVKLTRIDPYGLAIFSKIPFQNKDTLMSGSTPILINSIKIGERIIDIYSSYITPSINKTGSDKARKQLEEISLHILDRKNPVIVAGEFNDVYWSDKIRKFTSHNLLSNSRRNITPTSFNIPFDHIFYSHDLECTSFQNLTDIHENRMGILGRYQFKISKSYSLEKAAYGMN